MTTSTTSTQATPSNEQLAASMAAMEKTLKDMQAAQEKKDKKVLYSSIAVGSVGALAAIFFASKYITRALTNDDSATTDLPV